MAIDLSKVRKFEIDLSRGIAKADGPEDHARMMEALSLLTKSQKQHQQQPHSLGVSAPVGHAATQSGLTLMELLDKFNLLKKLRPATVLAHRNTVNEFSNFFQKKCFITEILVSDITRYQEFLATKGNVPRTIDGKVGYIKSLLNFAIKQGYLSGKNPAENMTLLTKKQKLTEGYGIFEEQEIQQIFSSEYFQEQKTSDPDYYYVLLLALVTGCRVSEITSLTRGQFQVSNKDNYLISIRNSKTAAGKREVPIPKILFTDFGLLPFLDEKKEAVFKYAPRDGKGSGNAVGKKFKRQLDELKIDRDKLVFHSIRKFLNDYFLKNGVEYEPRCQFFGHEIEAVNVATYSKKFSLDELSKITKPAQEKILDIAMSKKKVEE